VVGPITAIRMGGSSAKTGPIVQTPSKSNVLWQMILNIRVSSFVAFSATYIF
jgi:hypothetical protein